MITVKKLCTILVLPILSLIMKTSYAPRKLENESLMIPTRIYLLDLESNFYFGLLLYSCLDLYITLGKKIF